MGLLGAAALVWHWYPWSPDSKLNVVAEEPFDPSKIPLVGDRVQANLASYAQEPDFKAIAISRDGWGVALRAADVESAKREALDRCKQRGEKGFCRLYAVGNKVVLSSALFPLPFDVRAEPSDTPLTVDHGCLGGTGRGIEAHLKEKNHKAFAFSTVGFWSLFNSSSRAEVARLAAERCSDLHQTTCLLIAVDGFLTHTFPRSYRIVRPFTLTGESEMTPADKQRIGQIYGGKDWRALAKGGSQWYAVSGLDSEAAAVEEALAACRKTEPACTLHAIGNFRVGERKD